jgi:hypothetical protein
MKKIFLIGIIIVALAGCTKENVRPQQPVIETVKTIVIVPPKDMITLPSEPAVPDPDTATEKDVSLYIAALDSYSEELRNRIVAIVQFLLKSQDDANKKN